MNNSRTYIKVNLDNLIHNYKVLKNKAKNSKFMAVVKADAYGHGAECVAKTLAEEGCDYFAVATVDEGVELRNAGIEANIIVLGYGDTKSHIECVEKNITISISDTANAENLSTVAVKLNKIAKVHIKIDTGMSRYGFDYRIAAEKILNISKLDNIEIEGIYTHFAVADEPENEYTDKQFNNYMYTINQLKKLDIDIPIKHVANSATTMLHTHMQLDMVRCGIALYGGYPSAEVPKDLDLKPCMEVYTKVTRIRDLEKNTAISYGCTHILDEEKTVATLSIGYADGYSRILSNIGEVYIKNKSCPILGRICMDSCMADITDIEGLELEDDVEILGPNITAENLASKLGTVNYEVYCMFAKRVNRSYYKNNIEVYNKNYLVQ